jgi:hypothetical protein
MFTWERRRSASVFLGVKGLASQRDAGLSILPFIDSRDVLHKNRQSLTGVKAVAERDC